LIRERGGKEARGAVALPFLLAILCHREKLIFLSRKKEEAKEKGWQGGGGGAPRREKKEKKKKTPSTSEART
jgi:hypothetical protein